MRVAASLLAAATSLGVWLSSPTSARACGNIGPPTDPLTFAVVRSEGVFAVAGGGPQYREAFIEVRGPDGAVVAGVSERRDDRIVWRASGPLDARGRHEGAVFGVFDGQSTFVEAFELVVNDLATPALAPVELEYAVATEVAEGDDRLCCDEPISTCDRATCWAQSWLYPVVLDVQWRIQDQVAADLVEYVVRVPPDARVVREQSPRLVATRNNAAVRFPPGTERPCLIVEARHLLHGTTESAELCADHVYNVPRREPEAPVPQICDGNIYDTVSGEIVIPRVDEPGPVPSPDDVVDDGGGCAAGDASSGGAAAVLALLSARLRRRAARRSRR
jgi:hypothetical protein